MPCSCLRPAAAVLLILAAGAVTACGSKPPAEQPLLVRAHTSPAPETEPHVKGATCALSPVERDALTFLAGPGGTAVRHPHLGFSFVLPAADFQATREHRPLMLSALRDDDRTASHPYFDDFSRSFLVVRIAQLEDVEPSSLEAYLRNVESELEGGVKKELGANTGITPWSRSRTSDTVPLHVDSNTVFDDRLYVTLRAWPMRSRSAACPVAVVLVGVSISPQEMPSVMDSIELL